MKYWLEKNCAIENDAIYAHSGFVLINIIYITCKLNWVIFTGTIVVPVQLINPLEECLLNLKWSQKVSCKYLAMIEDRHMKISVSTIYYTLMVYSISLFVWVSVVIPIEVYYMVTMVTYINIWSKFIIILDGFLYINA